MTLFSSK